MKDWPTVWDPVPLDGRTPLTIRGRHIFGHIAGSTPLRGRAVSLDRFLTAGHRERRDGQHVPTGLLLRGGLPVAEVHAWPDRFGIACSGLLRPRGITASAMIERATPWPRWQVEGLTAHLVGIELDTSTQPVLSSLAAADLRQRALGRIDTARREHALSRIARARR